MKTYTLKEVTKKINMNQGKLKQWEKELEGILDIPRTKQGARIYTDNVIDQLLEIKQLIDKKFTKEMIRDHLKKKQEPNIPKSLKDEGDGLTDPQTKAEPNVPEHEPIGESEPEQMSLEVLSKLNCPAPVEKDPEQSAYLFFEAMDQYKDNFLREVKEEIRNVVRKEVVDEVKKEISKGALLTVKSLSDSVYKSSATTQAEIKDLSESIEKSSENTATSLRYLSNNIKNVSIETSEDIYNLSKQLSETSEEFIHYVDRTNNKISSLNESISKERDLFLEERMEFRQDLTKREVAFQEMLSSFRDVAATKEKKWWKFWA